MRAHPSARLLLGLSMLLVGSGLLFLGARVFVHRAAPLSEMVLDGAPVASPVEYVVPWFLAVVLVAAAGHLLRGPRDRLF